MGPIALNSAGRKSLSYFRANDAGEHEHEHKKKRQAKHAKDKGVSRKQGATLHDCLLLRSNFIGILTQQRQLRDEIIT